MITYYFPPLGGIGSVRAQSFARLLPKMGWDVTVLTPRAPAYYRDRTLDIEGVTVVRTGALELSRFGKHLTGSSGGDTRAARPTGVRAMAQQLARKFLYRPDAQVGWYPFAVQGGSRLLRDGKFDVIYSSSFPRTAHLAARSLRRRSNLPWVAEVRDWWDETEQDRLSPLVEESDALVTVSPTWVAGYERLGHPRVRMITNGYDRDVIESVGDQRPAATLTHLGTIYPDRTDYRVLWEAIRGLKREGKDIRLEFIGDPVDLVMKEVAACGLEEATTVTGFLPRKVALARAASASALILGGPKAPERILDGWIPAKTFEYLALMKPIVYTGSLECDVARILAKREGVYFLDPGAKEAAKASVARAIDHVVTTRPDIEIYSRERLAGRLVRVLEEAVGATT